MNIGIIGHFADGKEIYDGQTVKTRNIYEALKNDYNPIKLDTYEWKNKKIDTFINCIKMLKNNKNIIILTAQRGLFVFIPLFAMNSDVKLITMIIINNGVLVRYWDMTKLPRLNR